MNESKPYTLHIDGPLFRKQRELLLKIADLARPKQPYEPAGGDAALLEGLMALDQTNYDRPIQPNAGVTQ